MLKKIEDTLNRSCLIGLSYFNVQGEQLKQNILAGRVVNVDSEMGLTIELFANNVPSTSPPKKVHFIFPTDLSCWFTAPKGEFHTSQRDVKIVNPDYLVTWDIYQTKKQEVQDKDPVAERSQESEQQWWQWQPRTQPPNVG